jgi:hypothetical protein
MKLLLKEELRVLLQERNQHCVSIYMPTYRAGKEATKNPVKFKYLLKEAERMMVEAGVSADEASRILEPAAELLGDIYFWRHQSDGLAAFISPNLFRYYRLPVDFKELVVVTNRFHLKPLLSVLSAEGRFFILAISQNKSRLLQGTQLGVEEVDIDTLPSNLAETLKDEFVPKQFQFHTGTPPPPGGAGPRDAIFHGAGNEPDYKDAILRYFKLVDKGLHDFLKDEKAPLVIAGVDYLFPIYKQANTYPHLFEGFIAGNPELLSAKELHEKAWALLKPYFDREQKEAAQKFIELYDRNSPLASGDLKVVVPAAYHGRVDFVFVPVGVQEWGVFYPEQGEVRVEEEQKPGHEDLLDFVAIHTLLNGGTVYAVDPGRMPLQLKVAAVFRY